MKLSGIGLVLVMVVILSFGSQLSPVKSSEVTEHACHRPELLFPYLEIDRYNKSYPYVDYKAVVKPVLDYMLKRVHGVVDSSHELYLYWIEVCEATNPEKEVAAWRNLAQVLNHRMHTDESVYKIAKILFGDKMVALLMNPPDVLTDITINNAGGCFSRLSEIFSEHCGLVGDGYGMEHGSTFFAMCVLRVDEHEFADAVSQTCKDYVYAPSLPWEAPSLTSI